MARQPARSDGSRSSAILSVVSMKRSTAEQRSAACWPRSADERVTRSAAWRASQVNAGDLLDRSGKLADIGCGLGSDRPRSASTIRCGCQVPRPQPYVSCSSSSSLPAGWSAMAARWCRCCDVRPPLPKSSSSARQMLTMTPRLLILTLCAALATLTPAAAQFWQPPAQKAQPAPKGPPTEAQPARPDIPFAAFLKELWPDAQAKGVTRATFDLAFAGVTPDPRVMAITQRQPEYGRPAGAYIASLASKARIDAGTRKVAELAATLDAIESRYGVDRHILLAIWGIETSYGGAKDRWDVIRSLATLAQARYRHPYFRNELITAMLVLQQKHIARSAMVGSWAGAMGQPQFMPSSFLEHAVDFSGDGRRDIWTNVPDVLASIANYLQKGGWKAGLTQGFEVRVPAGFDYKVSRGSFADWNVLGLRRADGAPFPAEGQAILFFPSGARGPAFLVTDNFVVIKRYNNSDVYALAVAHLADRLRGRGPIQADWPSDDRQPTMSERIALQRKLAELGYSVRNSTGHFDFDLRDAIRDVQVKSGMVPDGHPTPPLLDRIGAKPARPATP